MLFVTVVLKLASLPNAVASSFSVFSAAGALATKFATAVSTYVVLAAPLTSATARVTAPVRPATLCTGAAALARAFVKYRLVPSVISVVDAVAPAVT